MDSLGYNERLFGTRSLRSRLHLARFHWLRDRIRELGCPTDTVLELGCFDGKTIHFIGKPRKYVGYDANWENGLEIARRSWKDEPNYEFIECTKPADFVQERRGFDISVSMETLEHIPTRELETYVRKLAEVTRSYSFITVPNEKGIVFLCKYLAKLTSYGGAERYSLEEIIHVTLGNLKRVSRIEGGHRGFDYEELIRLLARYFSVEKTEGIPFPSLPKFLNFTIGIVAQKANWK